ncbi:hypothetical protein [Sphingomonas sp. DT-204]|uniref:hypothetical protein n=1 Tax=Sphingomonas sp. DT-204 TaxID=3396166 RepID=UPI003F1AE62F
MDLNYLLSRHRTSLMRAETASCSEARLAHRALARCYAQRIGELRGELWATTAPIASSLRAH